MDSICLSVYSLFVLVCAFLLGLLCDSERLFSALRFAIVGFASVMMICISYAEIYITAPILGMLVVAALRNGRKYIIPILWIVTTLYMLVWILGGGMIPRIFYGGIYFIIYACLVILPCLGFAIAATVIRKKRKARGQLYVAENEHDSFWLFHIGNILSAISFIAMILGFRFIMISSDTFVWSFYYAHDGVIITTFVICVLAGLASMIMLKVAREEGGEYTAMDTALYIWSWVVAVISIVVFVIMLILFYMLGSGESSSTQQSGTRKVKDEKGKEQKLNYNGGASEESIDKNGEVWVTNDGGESFRKRDAYVYKDENNKDKVLYNRYGTTGGKPLTLEGDKGDIYDSDLWGNIKKRGDGNGDVIGQIRESDVVKSKVDE